MVIAGGVNLSHLERFKVAGEVKEQLLDESDADESEEEAMRYLRFLPLAVLLTAASSAGACAIVQIGGRWTILTGPDAICFFKCTPTQPFCFSTETNASNLTASLPQATAIRGGEVLTGDLRGQVVGTLKLGYCPIGPPLVQNQNVTVDLALTYSVTEQSDTVTAGLEPRCFVQGLTVINYQTFSVTSPLLTSNPLGIAVQPVLELQLKERLKSLLEEELWKRLHTGTRLNIYCQAPQIPPSVSSISCACS